MNRNSYGCPHSSACTCVCLCPDWNILGLTWCQAWEQRSLVTAKSFLGQLTLSQSPDLCAYPVKMNRAAWLIHSPKQPRASHSRAKSGFKLGWTLWRTHTCNRNAWEVLARGFPRVQSQHKLHGKTSPKQQQQQNKLGKGQQDGPAVKKPHAANPDSLALIPRVHRVEEEL